MSKRLNHVDAEHAHVAPKGTAAPEVLTLSGSADRTSQLAPGVYEIVATAAINWLQGGSSVTADGTSRYLPSGAFATVTVEGTSDAYVSCYGTATAYVQQL